MSRPDASFTAIILAGQRPGAVDALAAEAGVPNKSLVPICGAPLIRHVAEAIAATPGAERMKIVIEGASAPAVRALLADIRCPIAFVEAADNLADSVHAAAADVEGPMVITTSDNVLLTPGAVRQIASAVTHGADAAVAMATERSVLAAHPEGQRRFYRFADDSYSNCNLYALSGPGAAAAAEGFRSGGQFAKKPLRMIMALGPINLALLLMGRLTLRGALTRVSRRFRLKVEPVILADGAHAIDVDNARTYGCAETLLSARLQLAA